MIGKRKQARAQCQQVSSKVPAVHRRDVQRRQRLQGLRVIPVVEVAFVTFQSFHGPDCLRCAVEHLADGYVAEVVCGQVCKERKAHVGGRCAMCNRGRAILLVTVRRQPVVLFGHECLEKCPGLPGDLPQENGLISAQNSFRAGEGTAHPPGDGRRGKPEAQYGPGINQ